jgi:hypothetical protein
MMVGRAWVMSGGKYRGELGLISEAKSGLCVAS